MTYRFHEPAADRLAVEAEAEEAARCSGCGCFIPGEDLDPEKGTCDSCTTTPILIEFRPPGTRSKAEALEAIRAALHRAEIPGGMFYPRPDLEA